MGNKTFTLINHVVSPKSEEFHSLFIVDNNAK